jgi:hypothetical protein
MPKRLSKIYNAPLYSVYLIALTILLFRCTQNNNTETIEIDDFIPEAKGDYEYNDSVQTKEDQEDLIGEKLSQVFDGSVESINKSKVKIEDDWKYIPDRLASDSSLSRSYLIDSSLVILKTWKYKDSITNINAFYNWLDCFGDDCSSITVGDSIGVSKNAFLLFQDDINMYFVQSPDRLKENTWEEFFAKEQKNTSWNYVLKQTPRGIIEWEFKKGLK